MTCTLDHTPEGTIPEWLCRFCHPELNLTQEQRDTLDEADRERVNRERGEAKLRRDISRTKQKLTAITRRGEPDPGSVGDKIASALRKKLARLETEGGQPDSAN